LQKKITQSSKSFKSDFKNMPKHDQKNSGIQESETSDFLVIRGWNDLRVGPGPDDGEGE